MIHTNDLFILFPLGVGGTNLIATWQIITIEFAVLKVFFKAVYPLGAKKKKIVLLYFGASLVAQTVKDLPAMQETQVRSLGRDDPLEKGMATHSSILAWRIP